MRFWDQRAGREELTLLPAQLIYTFLHYGGLCHDVTKIFCKVVVAKTTHFNNVPEEQAYGRWPNPIIKENENIK